jgi:hypothetical protein
MEHTLHQGAASEASLKLPSGQAAGQTCWQWYCSVVSLSAAGREFMQENQGIQVACVVSFRARHLSYSSAMDFEMGRKSAQTKFQF